MSATGRTANPRKIVELLMTPAKASESRTILVIEDDEDIRGTVSTLLSTEGYKVETAADGLAGLERAFLLKPDLTLIDLKLPGLGGAEICRKLRAGRIDSPIIILSAASDEFDKVLLLELGADDYVTKPFGARELLARVKAALRRSTTAARAIVTFGSIQVDMERRMVTNRNGEVKLTPSEYNLLTYFLQNPDRALTREAILADVWGFESAPTTRTVDAHVVKLRQKLEADPTVPRHFLTVHGIGYRFVA
jgi:DNA-binding response OmpR family regulator